MKITSGGYQEVWRSAEITNNERRVDQAAGEADGEQTAASNASIRQPLNPADIGQFALLTKLIRDLRTVRNQNTFSDVNFILVISKADTYVDKQFSPEPDGEPQRFLTEFYRQLYREKILFNSPYDTPNTAQDDTTTAGGGHADTSSQPASIERDNLRSAGGVGSNPIRAELPDNSREGDIIEKHLMVFDKISHLALNSLTSLSDPELTSDPESQVLGQRIHRELAQRLQNIFGKKAFFLPVSAQGSMVEPDQNGVKKLDRVPNQKLAEYVFAAPCLLLLRDDPSFLAPRPGNRSSSGAEN
jgi:hypothetical protein